MDADGDSFLTNLDALNLTSPTDVNASMDDASAVAVGGRGRRLRSVTGYGAGPRGSPTSTQLDPSLAVFDFPPNLHSASASHHHRSSCLQSGASAGSNTSSGSMDLANFNNMFADKNVSDAGRREDGMPSMSHSQSTNPTQAHSNSNNVNFDALQQLLTMQMQFPSMSLPTNADGSSGSNHGSTTSNNPNATVLLEQQLRLHQLQQLQQLQNQIFQQQIELISGQASLSSTLDSTSMTSNQFQGLPTPVNSTELRPQPPPNFVSPMMLQNYLAQQGAVQQAGPSAVQFTSPHQLPQGSSSAPAHLAFSTEAPLMSPGDLDFELSPLTSPWLGAASYQQAQQQLQQHSQSQSQRPSSSHFHAQLHEKRRVPKRGASGSGEDANGHTQARKARQSPAIRATIGSGSASTNTKKAANSRGSASVSSTPAMRAQQSRRSSIVGEIVGDTPSPVDLSMPPPAPPSQSENNDSSSGASQMPVSSNAGSSAPSGCSSQGSVLSPVTPASIMNLGRLGVSSGLSSPLVSAEDWQAQENGKAKGKSKSKAPPKPINTSASAQGKSISKRASSTSLVSPSLKPLLPGGVSTSSAVTQLGSASNYSHHLSGSASTLHITPSTSLPPPTPAVRKTSHKAAEQKRRDSLKTSFDQLRLLLPPLPLPNEEGYLGAEGERLPPGAMPPRGPPRGDVTGPNRSVSKLMLLRCGNEYIRMLKGRVQRRDEYIADLKREVRALRARVDLSERCRLEGDGEPGGTDMNGMMDAMTEEIEKVDLEKELDAEEENAPRLGLGPLAEGGEDADEECE